MSEPIALLPLCITAFAIALIHTLFGPDHYIPFIVMSRSGRWSIRKTGIVTFFCGVGHVSSSVVLGLIGVALGLAVGKLTAVESFRGDLAAWALLAFGIVYCAWGLRRAWRNKPHTHIHFHGNGAAHTHEHQHHDGHVHVHEEEEGKANLTPWVLFTIFVFGPCEPLIPLVMYPAARHSLTGTILVAAVFSVVTIATMMTVVLSTSLGLSRLPTRVLDRYTHALAGGAIALCGAGMVFLGL